MTALTQKVLRVIKISFEHTHLDMKYPFGYENCLILQVIPQLKPHYQRLNVIQLPDKDIKHSNKTNRDEENISTELSNMSSENLFANQDGLILIIQGGCKRWRDLFGLYVTNWIADQDREYRRKLLLRTPEGYGNMCCRVLKGGRLSGVNCGIT